MKNVILVVDDDKTNLSLAQRILGPQYRIAACNSGTAAGVDLTGLKYPLQKYTLTADFPLGVSNQFLDVPATVSVEKGSLLLVWEDQGDFYSILPELWPDRC